MIAAILYGVAVGLFTGSAVSTGLIFRASPGTDGYPETHINRWFWFTGLGLVSWFASLIAGAIGA